MDWKATFESALPYEPLLEKHGSDEERAKWKGIYDKLELTDAQRDLLGGFKRQMNALVLVGVWCGDCITQGPVLQRIAEASGNIDLRFVNRDDSAGLQEELQICGGNRVPVAVFLSEDFFECSRYGDRTLSRYRQLAADRLGGACPLPSATPEDLLQSMTADWLAEFERIQLMLLLSGRLKQKHGD